MKYLILALVALTSCRSTDWTEANHRSVYVNYGEANLTSPRADTFNTIPSGEVGIMYGGDDGNDDGRVTGLVGDIAVRGLSGGDGYAGYDVSIDALGLRPGLRYYFDTGTRYAQPYVGAGVLFQQTWFQTDVPGDDASAFTVGGIGMAGLDVQLTQRLRFGVSYQMTGGIDPKVDGNQVDLDSGTLMFGLGFSF